MLCCGNALAAAAAAAAPTLRPRKQAELLFAAGRRFWSNGTFLKCQEIRWHRQLWLITYQQARGKQQIPQIQLWLTLSRCFVSLLGKNTDFPRAIFQLWTRVNDVALIYEWKILDKANTCFCGLALWLDNLSNLECVGQAVFQERDNVCCLSWHLVGQYTCFGCDWGIWYFTNQDFNGGWHESEKSNRRYVFKALLCVIEDSN